MKKTFTGSGSVWLVGTARCAVPGGRAAGRDAQNADFTTFVAPAIRARTAQRAVPTQLPHYPFIGWVAFFTAVLVMVLFTGCVADKTEIEFTSSGSLPKLDANSTAFSPDKKNSLPEAEERKIEMAVFGDLLTRHFWDDGGYSAIFLQADDDTISAMQKKFPDRKPPIKETYRINVQPNRAPRDQDTGQAAMILSVDIGEPDADGSVSAIGKWFAGGAVTGFYTYQLKKGDDGNWQIQNSP